MKIIPVISLLTACVLTVVATPALAEEAKMKKDPVAKSSSESASSKKEKAASPTTKKIPFYGKVVAATARSITIKSSENSAERKIILNSQTKIIKDQQPATSKDIVIGRWVGGSVERAADGSETAASLNLSAKQKFEKNKPVAKTSEAAGKSDSIKGEAKTAANDSKVKK